MGLPPQDQYEALRAAQMWYSSEEGTQGYKQRAGVEGTLSQGVRGFGLRRARYRGLEKTHLQHVAIAAAINVDRIVAWLDEPTGQDTDLPLRRAHSRLRPTLWDRP